MTGNQQASETKIKAQRQPKAETFGAAPTTAEAVLPVAGLPGSLASAGGTMVDSQVAWLGNGQMQAAQRVQLATEIGWTQGNQHLQCIMASLQGGRQAGTAYTVRRNDGHRPAAAQKPSGGGVTGSNKVETAETDELGCKAGWGSGLSSLVSSELSHNSRGRSQALAQTIQRLPEKPEETEWLQSEEERAALVDIAPANVAQPPDETESEAMASVPTLTETPEQAVSRVAPSGSVGVAPTAISAVVPGAAAVAVQAQGAASPTATPAATPEAAETVGQAPEAMIPSPGISGPAPLPGSATAGPSTVLEASRAPAMPVAAPKAGAPSAAQAATAPTAAAKTPSGLASRAPATQVGELQAQTEERLTSVEAQAQQMQQAATAQARAGVRADAARMPSLEELLGPIEQAPEGIGQGAVFGPPSVVAPSVFRQPEPIGGDERTPEIGYDAVAARAQVQSFANNLAPTADAEQQRIGAEAETVRADLTANADALRQSIEGQVEAALVELQTTCAIHRANLEASLQTARDGVTGALAERQAEATSAGTQARAELASLFEQHRADVDDTIEEKISATEDMRTRNVSRVHERLQSQATEARERGHAKAATYPSDTRGSEQASAAQDVAEETAQEILEQEPDAVEAIGELVEDIPDEFRDTGEEAREGLDDKLPEALDAIDQQVQAALDRLNEQAVEANSQLDAFAEQVLSQIDALETAAEGQIRAVLPQAQSQIDSALQSTLDQINEATPHAEEQVRQVCDQGVQTLLSLESPDVEASQEFATELQNYMSGIADSAVAGLQQAGTQISDGLQQIEIAAAQTLQGNLQQADGGLQDLQDSTDSTLIEFQADVDEALGDTLLTLEDGLEQTREQVEEQLGQGITELAGRCDQTLREVEPLIVEAANEGLAKGDEALAGLDAKMNEAAEDAAWNYDHPILATLASIGAVIAGIVIGLAALVVVILAFKGLLLAIAALAAVSAVAALIAKVALVVAVIGLVVYGVYSAYRDRAAREGGGWGTFGMALLDFTGITSLYQAITTPGLSPLERFQLAASGTFQLGGTILMIYGGWRFVQTGGLRGTWARLRGPRAQGRAPTLTEEAPVPTERGLVPGEEVPASSGTRPSPVAEDIANGHAFDKHVIRQNEFPGINTRQQFAAEIDRAIANHTHFKNLSNGRSAYWDNASGTVVIRNPAAADGGTCFRPTNGKAYFDNLH